MSSAQHSLSPLRIEITCKPNRKYKSIESLTWDNIPPLAIITGPNGSGKSQLLELLALTLTARACGVLVEKTHGIDITVSGGTVLDDSVSYMQSGFQFTTEAASGISFLQNAKNQYFATTQNSLQSADPRQLSRWARISTFLKSKNVSINHETFAKEIPDDLSFLLEDVDIISGIANVFFAYRIRVAQKREQGLSDADARLDLGDPPWELINEEFKIAEFPYQLVSPLKSKFDEQYNLRLESQISGDQINPGDLSSGEKMIMTLVLWTYNSKHNGRTPKLLLLDEPDAHLHPSLAGQMIKVLKDVLVDRHGTRVILTTHSPSTVALAPPGSVFEMSRLPPRIRPSNSTAATIGLLTAGLVVVSSSTRIVLTEDESDVAFYETFRELLTDYGPSRDARAIHPTPSLIFLASSRGSGAAKIGGGCSMVRDWVNKFDEPPLNEIIRGVIDRDVANTASMRIPVLGRYSIENYLLDPFVIFCLLSAVDRPITVPGVVLSIGDEHLIRDLPEEDLQTIVGVIQAFVEPHLSNFKDEEKINFPVLFTSGKTVQYPNWMLNRRGHDLMNVYQLAFNAQSHINPLRLRQTIKRLRLIPIEIAEIFAQLQGQI